MCYLNSCDFGVNFILSLNFMVWILVFWIKALESCSSKTILKINYKSPKKIPYVSFGSLICFLVVSW